MEEKKTDKMEQQPLFIRPEGGEEDEVTIDWMALIRRIFAIRRKLYLAAAVGLLAGVIIALSIPKQYTVSVTLSPEMGSGKSGGGLASMAASFLTSPKTKCSYFLKTFCAIFTSISTKRNVIFIVKKHLCNK